MGVIVVGYKYVSYPRNIYAEPFSVIEYLFRSSRVDKIFHSGVFDIKRDAVFDLKLFGSARIFDQRNYTHLFLYLSVNLLTARHHTLHVLKPVQRFVQRFVLLCEMKTYIAVFRLLKKA